MNTITDSSKGRIDGFGPLGESSNLSSVAKKPVVLFTSPCVICGTLIKTFPSLVKAGRSKSCSKKCLGILLRQRKIWNKGKKLHYSVWNKGIVRTDISGENHPNWKGDNVGYQGVHQWVRKMMGAPRICIHCHTTQSKSYDWANVSGEYRRELSDWIRLCRKCHNRYDNIGRKSANTRMGVTL